MISIVACQVYCRSRRGSWNRAPSSRGRQSGDPVITGTPIPASAYSVNVQPVQPYTDYAQQSNIPSQSAPYPGTPASTAPPPSMPYPGTSAPPGPRAVSPYSDTPAATAPPPSYTEALSAPYGSDTSQGTQRQASDSGLPSYDAFTKHSS